MKVNCPTCYKKIIWSTKEPWRPFCSERCKLIDLGEWAGENHRIAGEQAHMDTQLDERDTSDQA